MAVSNEEFVRAWQSSYSVAEAASKTGMDRGDARARASYLRKRGVKLKTFYRKREGVDVASLNAVVAEEATKQAAVAALEELKEEMCADR